MSAGAVNSFGSVSVPQDVSFRIFAGLNAESLTVVNLVCKHWNLLTKNDALLFQLDLKTLFKRVSFIDEPVWQAHVNLADYGLSFEGNVANQCDIIRGLQKCLSWPIQIVDKIKPGITLVDIPKGLSINKLRALAPQLFLHVHPDIITDHGDVVVDKPYKLILSDHVMEETHMKNAQQQLTVIEKHGAQRPKAIEKLTLFILTCLNTGKKLCGKTYIRCEEQVFIEKESIRVRGGAEIGVTYQVVVGGLGWNGIFVGYFDREAMQFSLSAKHQFSQESPD